jgi:hypothetical protein
MVQRTHKQEAPRKTDRRSPIMMASTTNLIRLQRDLKTTSKESTGSEIHEVEIVSLQKKWRAIQP